MRLYKTLSLCLIAASSLILASCGGGGGSLQQLPASSQPMAANPPASGSASTASSVVHLTQSASEYPLPLPQGYSGSITLSAPQAPPNATLTLTAGPTVAATTRRNAASAPPCPPPPLITLQNPFSVPITVKVISFTVIVPCTVTGQLFGVSFFQTVPQPQMISSLKLGDVTANGQVVSFNSTTTTLTLGPKTTNVIAIAQEKTTADVTLPVVPNANTELTSNAPTLPSSLSFNYTTAIGGTTYASACFPAHDSGGNLASVLVGVAIAGTPSFYCTIDPGVSSITFGNLVKFFIGQPKVDANVFGFDGPPANYLCSNAATPECDTPSFNVPTYQNLIVSNAQDMKMCVPVTAGTDCNNISGAAVTPPSTLNVKANRPFQLLVADDPSYKPGTQLMPVPWSGLFSITSSGNCSVSTGPEKDNGDEPTGYNEQTGLGPDAEYDAQATSAGTCTLTVKEDQNFITDFSNPASPTGRSITLTVNVVNHI